MIHGVSCVDVMLRQEEAKLRVERHKTIPKLTSLKGRVTRLVDSINTHIQEDKQALETAVHLFFARLLANRNVVCRRNVRNFSRGSRYVLFLESH